MRILIQLLAAAVFAAGGVIATAHLVPATRPFLDDAGIMALMEQAGVAPSDPEAAQGAAGGPPGGGPPFGRGGPATVVAIVPEIKPVIADIAAIGTGLARRTVEVRPEAAGRLVEVLVRSGQRVEAGDVLARLEAETEEIALTRAALELSDAETQFDRQTRLRSAGTASEIQLANAELALRRAELAHRQAEFNLARRVIRAPFDGIAGIVDLGPGDQIGTSDSLVRLDDRAELLIDFTVPERFVPLVSVGAELEATPLGDPDLVLPGRISAIENRVDPQTRTIRLQAAVENRDDRLRAGMAFAIRMQFEGDSYPAVDPLAIQWSTDGAFVWLVRDGRALRKPVRIVQRTARLVLVAAEFDEGDRVVIEGIQALRPGAEVSVRGDPPPEGGPDDSGRDRTAATRSLERG